MRFGVINIIHRRDDNPLIFNQIYRVVFTRDDRGCAHRRMVLLLPGHFKFLQHAHNTRFLIRLENVVKCFQFERFDSMLFPCSDKNNKRLMGELIDILCKQNTVQ
ncbi:hypothetical protein D3C80_1921240 [compost metagenome]